MKVLSLSHKSLAPLRTTWDDVALVQALAQDDALAFAEIYERYYAPLHAQARRKLPCDHDAEELVQDLFVALWHKRHTAAIQQLNAYLFAALKYRVIDCVRARLVRKNYAATFPQHLAKPDRGTEETVAAADLSAALAASVGSLPGHAQEVFRLSRMEHRSVPEIAAHLRVSAKTVEYHLSRSLKLLRLHLRDFLVGVALFHITIDS